jgi:hypothetical protein
MKLRRYNAQQRLLVFLSVRIRRIVFWLSAALVAFILCRIFVETQREGIVWFVSPRHAVLQADGKLTTGWLHREWKRRWVIVTLNSSGKRESYLVTLSSNPKRVFVEECGDWTASHFPVFPFPVLADHGLVCAGWFPDLSQKVKLMNHTLRLGRDSAEFTDVNGLAIHVSWE